MSVLAPQRYRTSGASPSQARAVSNSTSSARGARSGEASQSSATACTEPTSAVARTRRVLGGRQGGLEHTGEHLGHVAHGASHRVVGQRAVDERSRDDEAIEVGVGLDEREVRLDGRGDEAPQVWAAAGGSAREGTGDTAHDPALDARHDGPVEAGPVVEVAIDHRLARARLGGDVIHADAGPVPPDRADGRVDELGAPRLTVPLPARVAAVTSVARTRRLRRGRLGSQRRRAGRPCAETNRYSMYRLQAVSVRLCSTAPTPGDPHGCSLRPPTPRPPQGLVHPGGSPCSGATASPSPAPTVPTRWRPTRTC